MSNSLQHWTVSHQNPLSMGFYRQEYTELHKNIFNDLDNYDGVVTHLEPDILEYEVKCTLGSTTMNRLGTRVHLWRIHVDVWQNQYNIIK